MESESESLEFFRNVFEDCNKMGKNLEILKRQSVIYFPLQVTNQSLSSRVLTSFTLRLFGQMKTMGFRSNIAERKSCQHLKVSTSPGK